MSEEKPDQMRVNLLKQFAALALPATVGVKDSTPAELAMIRRLFRDDLLEGDVLPDHTGSGIAAIHVTGVSPEAHAIIAESAPVARATKTAKRVGVAAWRVIIGIILLLGALWAAIDHWPKIQELLGVSPPPTSAAPVQSIQGPQQQSAPAAQPLPSASTPTPPTQNP